MRYWGFSTITLRVWQITSCSSRELLHSTGGEKIDAYEFSFCKTDDGFSTAFEKIIICVLFVS